MSNNEQNEHDDGGGDDEPEKTGGLWRYRKGHGNKYVVLRARDGSLPEWPYFVLAASDPMAPIALRFYAAMGRHHEAFDIEYCADVGRLANEFEAWRKEHYEGKPDTLPPAEAPDPAEKIRQVASSLVELLRTLGLSPEEAMLTLGHAASAIMVQGDNRELLGLLDGAALSHLHDKKG